MIRTLTDGPVLTVLLHRPERRNALTPEMLAAIATLPSTLPASIRALVLAGEGSVFCSGFDLALCQSHPDGSVMRTLLTGLHEAIGSLRSLPIPVVAAVQGAAIAGGCALLGGADIVVTHDDAKFGYPVLRLGISPGVSGPFLRGAIGDGPTRERFLDTALINGAEARRLGLAHECVPVAAVGPRATEIARALGAKPAGAVSATRRWLLELEDRARLVPESTALDTSLSLTGKTEERERLSALAQT